MSDNQDKDTTFINWNKLKIVCKITFKYTLFYGIIQTISHKIIESLLSNKMIKLSDTTFKHSKMVYAINLFTNSVIQLISHHILFTNNHFSINYFIESMKTAHITKYDKNKWTLNTLIIAGQYFGWSVSDLIYLYFKSNRKQMKQQIPHHIVTCVPIITNIALNIQSEFIMAGNVNTSMSGTISGFAQFLNALLSDNNFQNNKFGLDINLFYKYVKYLFIITFIYTRTIGGVLGILIVFILGVYKGNDDPNIRKYWLYKFRRMQGMVSGPILIWFQLKWTKQLLTKLKNGQEFWIKKTI
eukprot:457586_1